MSRERELCENTLEDLTPGKYTALFWLISAMRMDALACVSSIYVYANVTFIHIMSYTSGGRGFRFSFGKRGAWLA